MRALLIKVGKCIAAKIKPHLVLLIGRIKAKLTSLEDKLKS